MPCHHKTLEYSQENKNLSLRMFLGQEYSQAPHSQIFELRILLRILKSFMTVGLARKLKIFWALSTFSDLISLYRLSIFFFPSIFWVENTQKFYDGGASCAEKCKWKVLLTGHFVLWSAPIFSPKRTSLQLIQTRTLCEIIDLPISKTKSEIVFVGVNPWLGD
jgi:hypothetical protein